MGCEENTMGLFDRIFGKSQKRDHSPIKDRSSISADEIDRMQRIEASANYRNKIYRRYYSDYPEMPFISQDREINTNWLEQAGIFSSLVEKKMMKRYGDGLLPGHIYMLYWLGKSNRKRIPSYFEYRYGINFEKERVFLTENGYLNNNKPTEKGVAAIERHKNIIEERHPSPLNSGKSLVPAPEQGVSKRIIPHKEKSTKENVPNQDIPLLESEISYINDMIQYACKLSNIAITPKINILKFAYGLSLSETHYEWTPYTPTGKSSKYPLMLRYSYKAGPNDIPPNECFGEIHYLQNGAIGKARLIFWQQGVGYFFHFGQTQNTLDVKKVEKSVPPDRIILYKE